MHTSTITRTRVSVHTGLLSLSFGFCTHALFGDRPLTHLTIGGYISSQLFKVPIGLLITMAADLQITTDAPYPDAVSLTLCFIWHS